MLKEVQQENEELIESARHAVGSAQESMNSGFLVSKDKLASAMESGSEKMVSGAIAIEDTAVKAASHLADGAKYLREKSGGDIVQDCCGLVEKYPFHAVGAAVIAGLLIGKGVWGNRPE